MVIGYDTRIGFSPTSPSDELIAFVEAQGWSEVSLSRMGMAMLKGGSTGKTVSKVRKYQCPVCKCSCRATKEIHISCMDCDTIMELQENVG